MKPLAPKILSVKTKMIERIKRPKNYLEYEQISRIQLVSSTLLSLCSHRFYAALWLNGINHYRLKSFLPNFKIGSKLGYNLKQFVLLSMP